MLFEKRCYVNLQKNTKEDVLSIAASVLSSVVGVEGFQIQ